MSSSRRPSPPRTTSTPRSTTATSSPACARSRTGTHFQLLETLAASVADELKRRFQLERVEVRVGKPDLRLEGGLGHGRRRAVTRAYVGVGANLGDREATIRAALAALPGVVGVSQLRETDPVGVVDQPPFLNGAAALETDLSPARAARRAAGCRARARTRAPRALGPAHDRSRSAALRRRDDRRAGVDRPAPAPARAPVRARAAPRPRSRAGDSGPRTGGRPACRATLSG